MSACPYDGTCPHVSQLRSEFNRYEEHANDEFAFVRKTLGDMRKTLYIIAGILIAELGVTII